MTKALCLLPLALAACASFQHPLHGDPVESEFVIPRDDARTASIEILTQDDLVVNSGECSLVQARARYDADRARANVDYTLDEAGFGQLKLALERTSGRGMGHGDWDVCIAQDIPLSLRSEGNGDMRFDLESVQLRGLDVTSGAGDIDLDLRSARIADATISLQIGAGDMSIDARMATITGPVKLVVAAGAGDLDVQLPGNVALRVEVEVGVGDLDVDGLDKGPDGYVNAAWSDENVTARLHVKVEAGAGDIDIEVESEDAIASTP